MLSRTASFLAVLIIALVVPPLGGTTDAIADSGGYRRPQLSQSYGSGWSSPQTAPSSSGYRRPSTYGGGGYATGSAGDLSISRSTSAQALQQYRASQRPRRPPVASTEPTWMGGGYVPRRPPTYAEAPYGAGGFGSPTFWAMLAALSAADRATYFRQSQADPAYQQWHQQAVHDPGTASRLAALGDQSTGQPGGAAATDAGASGGSSIVWVVLFIGGAVFVLLWVARRRVTPASAGGRPGLHGSTTSRFRVGQTIPLDPAQFLLAAGATKVKPPAEAGMIS
jgi:hypothetical protein